MKNNINNYKNQPDIKQKFKKKVEQRLRNHSVKKTRSCQEPKYDLKKTPK